MAPGRMAGSSDKQFRETLTLFAVDPSLENTMLAVHRPSVLPLLSTILYSKLTQRAGRGGSKSTMAQRRTTIFAFFCSFQPAELRQLVDLVLAPLTAVGATTVSKTTEEARSRATALVALRPPQLIGTLRSLHDAVAQLGSSLTCFLPELVGAISHLLLYVTHCACTSVGTSVGVAGANASSDADQASQASQTGEEGEEGPLLPPELRLGASVPATLTLQQAREARLWSMKLLNLCLQAFSDCDLVLLMRLALGCLAPVLRRLHTHYTQSPAGLLSTLLILVEQPATLCYLELSTTPVLPCVFSALSAPKARRHASNSCSAPWPCALSPSAF